MGLPLLSTDFRFGPVQTSPPIFAKSTSWRYENVRVVPLTEAPPSFDSPMSRSLVTVLFYEA